jgi:aminoglycoside phosphotransferase (APT) family kinase protein
MATVGSHVLRERVRGKPTNLPPAAIPPSADGLTPAWLSAVLCRGVHGALVTDVEITRRTSGTSSRAALRVGYNDVGTAAGLPTNLFAKSTASWKQRLLLGLGDMIQRETLFFNHVRPLVEFEAPIGYYAGYDERSWRSLCLMEDVAVTRGATFLEPTSRVSRGAMNGLLATLATLHGTFWESPAFAQELAFLTTPRHFKAKISALIGMRERSLSGARRAGSLIPAELSGRQDDLWEAYGRSFQILSEPPFTVLHGDSHIGNTYQTAHGEMGFADWQVTSKGGWAYDVAYTLTTGLTIEDRRAWEQELIGSYIKRLAEAGGPALDFDTARLSYRRAVPHAYFAWVFALGQSRLQPAMQPSSVSREMIARTSQALADLNTLAALGL